MLHRMRVCSKSWTTGKWNNSYEKCFINAFNITWIIHQIFIYSDEVMFTDTLPSFPSPPPILDE